MQCGGWVQGARDKGLMDGGRRESRHLVRLADTGREGG